MKTDGLPLREKRALVTGGAGGVGLATARRLAQEGANVAIADYRDDLLHAARQAFASDGLSLRTWRADNRKVAEIEACATALGPIDILVNNAGISGNSLPIEAIDEAAFAAMFDTHVKGAFFYTRAVIPGMKQRGFGRIVNIASHFAMIGFAGMSHYVGAKGALSALARAWACEFAAYGITANTVAPALLDTQMTRASIGGEELAKRAAGVPMGRLATPDDIAAAIAWLVGPDGAMMTGQTISPNGGMAIVGL